MSPPFFARLLVSKNPQKIVFNATSHAIHAVVGLVFSAALLIILVILLVFMFMLISELYEKTMSIKIKKTVSLEANKEVKQEFNICERRCCICFEDLKTFNCLKLNCGHVFHRHCASKWYTFNQTCAMCRCKIS